MRRGAMIENGLTFCLILMVYSPNMCRLNEAECREGYQMPSVEESLAQ